LLLLPLAAFKPFGRSAQAFSRADWAPAIASDVMYVQPVAAIPEIPEIPEVPDVPSMPPEAWSELQHQLHDVRAAMQDVHAAHMEVATAATEASTAMAEASDAMRASIASVTTTPAVASWSGTNGSCSSVSLKKTGKSTSVSSSSDDDDNSFQYISSSAGRCVQVAVWGHVDFSPDEREVQRVSRDGRLYIRERKQDSDREVEVTPGDDEAPRYAFRVDGERVSFDDDGRAWLGDLLPEILRESGLNARARVARIRRGGGVSAVLADISHTESTSAKRAAFDALLKEGNLSDDDLTKIAQKAGEDLSSSDGELAAVLSQVGKMGRGSSTMAEAFGNAVERMSSDGEKRELLQQYALKGDREMLCVAGRQAKSISSDGEKSEFLRATVNSYLSSDDETLRKMFFDVVGTISSDGERHEVLNSALPYAQRPAVLLAVLESAKDISSDGEKSELLVTILHKKLVTTPALKEVFMKVTRSLSSDGEYRRVMEAALTS
jgi:hypothetical protein